MKATTHAARQCARAICALVALLAAGAAAAQAAAGAEAAYRAERAACMSGQSHQDRQTCLEEAGAALAEARRGRLGNGRDAGQYQRNALARCEVQPESEREACRAIVRGAGTVTGSVEQGAIVRELVTRVPAPEPPVGR